MRFKTAIALWAIFIIFPAAWLSRMNPVWAQWFDRIFSPEWMHVASHFILFMVLGAGLTWIQDGERSARVVASTMTAVFLVGVLQEIMQMFSQGGALTGGTLLDWGVDLFGGAAGLAAASLLKRRQKMIRIISR